MDSQPDVNENTSSGPVLTKLPLPEPEEEKSVEGNSESKPTVSVF